MTDAARPHPPEPPHEPPHVHPYRRPRDPPAPEAAPPFPLKPQYQAGILSLALWLLSAVIVWIVARDTTPGWVLGGLLAVNAGALALWLAGCVLARDRARPGREAALRRIARGVIVCCHVACAGLIWLVMPGADAEAQLIISVFLMAYIPTQVISSPENTAANRAGIVVVLGSLALFLATRGAPHLRMLAGYIAVYAVLMWFVSRTVGDTVRRTFEAQLDSLAAARMLENLLADVAAERDAKTRFIATASHDLGQPLQSAALFFDQMLRTPDPAAHARAADGVQRSFAAAEQLLAHMLNHLRLEADAVEPRLSRVALGPLLARIAARHPDAAPRIRVLPTRLTLPLDPVLIERALGNLVQNAVLHSGGTRVLLGARRHAGRVRIWVIDDGAGISRADRRHIFDDYFQGQSARRPGAGGGFGLGLSSVRRIARLMDGEAGLEPRWLHGAAFYLDFPASLSAQPARAVSNAGAA